MDATDTTTDATNAADAERAERARAERDAAEKLFRDLCAADAKARAAGHSLVEVLVIAGKNAFGIDIRPDDEPADETAEA